MSNVINMMDYTSTNRFRRKTFRKATRIQALKNDIALLQKMLKEYQTKLQMLTNLNGKLIEQLARLGIKVVVKDGELLFEQAR